MAKIELHQQLWQFFPIDECMEKQCNIYCSGPLLLTHVPLVPHIYASVNLVGVGSGNGLSPVRRQAIIGTNVCLLSIGALETNVSEIWAPEGREVSH